MIYCAYCGSRTGIIGRCTVCKRKEKHQEAHAALIAAYEARRHEIEGDTKEDVACTYPLWSMPDEVIAGRFLATLGPPSVCIELLKPFTKHNSMTGHLPMEQAKRIVKLIKAAA